MVVDGWVMSGECLETDWPQDESYWPSGMVDKRALTIWSALDAADMANGAMW